MRPWFWLTTLALLTISCNKDGDGDTGMSGTTPAGTATATGTATSGGTPTGATTSFAWPETAEDYPFSGITYLHGFTIPTADALCCRDFGSISKDFIENGTNELDNALAGIATVAGTLGFSLQDTIDEAVQSGNFVALIDHYDWPGVQGGSYHMAFFRGEYDPSTTFAVAEAGAGLFRIPTQNFIDGTGEPVATFDMATFDGAIVDAAGGTIEIAMPITDTALLVVPMQDVEMTASANESGASVAMQSGQLSGFVTVTDLYDSYNFVVNEACGCLGLSGDLVEDNGDGTYSYNCVSDAATLCTATGEEACATLAGTNLFGGEICSGLDLFIGGVADLDLDGDTTTFEGLSVGLTFQGSPGAVSGLITP